jgi:hypothetical protein
MRSKSLASLLALIQFSAILQIFIGFVVLPAAMHRGDSVILGTIDNDDLRARISRWHDREVRFASRWLYGFGVVQLVLSSVAVLAANHGRDSAAEKNSTAQYLEAAAGRREDFEKYLAAVPNVPSDKNDHID